MKKYSEKYIDKYKILKNATIGFEFEALYNISYYKALECLNQELAPIKVHGFREYHPDFEVDQDNFCLTPDYSCGVNGVEIITGAMDYYTAKHYMIKIFKFIQKYGYTTDKTAIHINLSFKDMNISRINTLKLILDIDEDAIYKSFPSRKNNIYAKSIKNMIPFKDYSFSDISIDKIKHNVKFNQEKYFGINFSHLNNDEKSKRLEFRYLGGKDYEQKIGDIMDIMDDFIIKTYESIVYPFNDVEIDQLEKFLSNKINTFKSFETYDKFLIEFPYVVLQIDQISTYDLVNSVFPKIQKKLYEFFESVDSVSENTIINFYTTEQRMEIVNSTFKGKFKLNGYDLINCNITDSMFDNCMFNNCEINNTHVQISRIVKTTISNSKIYNSDADVSELDNCYFENGYMNSRMIGGILRSGKLGLYADISDTTEVVNETGDNFFNTNIEDDKKGIKGIK